MTVPRWFDEWTPAQRLEYADRHQKRAQQGIDIDGEARLIDAMAERGSRILDAGCGTGRIAQALARAGHLVLGVDIDPTLIEAGRRQYPDLPLAELDLVDASPAIGSFDLIVCAGNVMVYLAPGSERRVLAALASVLEPGGRTVFGFATDRDYTIDSLDADAESVGWTLEARFGTWDLAPYSSASDWAVSIYRG